MPRLAQIMAVADVFDALTAQRHYRDAMTKEEAIGILRDEAANGKHDPQLIELFVSRVVGQGSDPVCGAATGGNGDQSSNA